jgi:hypothetical protein
MQPKNYITTFNKKRFSPFSITPDDILIEDIAHALSYMCRANGHFDRFYSVAQHSLNCAREARERGFGEVMQLLLLLHDASETYISDITRPVKMHLPDYKALEAGVSDVIKAKFGLPEGGEADKAVEDIDFALLCAEFKEMAGEAIDREDCSDRRELVSVPDFSERDFRQVRAEFLQKFHELKNISKK